jgi:hypothetical protein
LIISDFNENIIKVATGREFSMMLNSKGFVFVFGKGVIIEFLIFPVIWFNRLWSY